MAHGMTDVSHNGHMLSSCYVTQ